MMPTGVTYKKDFLGRNRYLRIDLKQHGTNQLLEDFLDGLEVEASKDETTRPLREIIDEQNKKRGF